MSDSESKKINMNDIIYSFFSSTSIGLVLAFLGIYFIVFVIIKLFYDTSSNQNELPAIRGKFLDVMIFGLLLFYVFTSYVNLNENKQKNYIHDNLKYTKEFINKTTSIFSVISFILGFYLCVYFLQIDMSYDKKPMSISFIDGSMWTVFIVLLICDFFSIFLNVSLVDNLFGDLKEEKEYPDYDISEEDTSGNEQQDEVFNVSNNLYTYHDAPEVCATYGAKLATYDQVEESYNNGGEWCNYGWSLGQMALFPTQKSTWNKLQGSEETKNKCGRPGVNGGYMENDGLLFGVNCFGKKPAATDKDLAFMDANKEVVIPKTREDAQVNLKMDMWKKNPDIFLKLNSFNRGNWNE